MLRKLSGMMHRVITGFTILYVPAEKLVSDFEATEVTFFHLPDEEIECYIKTGESFDKAGAYGAQGRGGLLIKQTNGCFSNVVGLPLAKLRRKWMEFALEVNNG